MQFCGCDVRRRDVLHGPLLRYTQEPVLDNFVRTDTPDHCAEASALALQIGRVQSNVILIDVGAVSRRRCHAQYARVRR